MKKKGPIIKDIGNNIRLISNILLQKSHMIVILIPVITIIIGQKSVVSSWLIAQIFNNLQYIVEGNHDNELLEKAIICGGMLFAINIIDWLLTTILDLLNNIWHEKVYLKLQKIFIEKDYRLNIGDYDNIEIQNRRTVAKETDLIEQAKTCISFASKLFITISYSIVLWSFHPWFVLIALMIKIPSFFVLNKINQEGREFHVKTNNIIREKNYYQKLPIEKKVSKELKIFNMGEFICDKFDCIIRKYYSKYKEKYIGIETKKIALDGYGHIIDVLTQIVLGCFVFSGEVLFGDYTLLIASFKNVSGAFENIIEALTTLNDVHQKNIMLREYLQDDSIFERGEKAKLLVPDIIHSIEFKNVSFVYPNTNVMVIDHLNMTITKNGIYGIVGLNGSGKSTLVNLLLRMYEPNEGEILINGININNFNIYSYYSNFSCAFQNTNKHSVSIIDYISCGDRDVNKVEMVLKQVNLYKWYRQLPNGMDTVLSRQFYTENESIEPSTGQWQKLSIARALYKNSPIVILDEPSSSMDVQTENEIFELISKVHKDKIIILISHRLSNLISSDCIYMLKDGKMIEKGSHKELIDKNGCYAKMFKNQAELYKSGI